MEAWYVFYCSSRAEKKVFERLRLLRFDVFLPLRETLKQWSDRKKKVAEPLFPGYVFVRCKPSEITCVASTAGIAAPVRLAGKPAFITPDEVDAIRLYLQSGYYAEVNEHTFVPGDRIRVTDGPLSGIEGHCLRVEGKEYLCIMLPSFNHMLKIHLHMGKVAKIS